MKKNSILAAGLASVIAAATVFSGVPVFASESVTEESAGADEEREYKFGKVNLPGKEGGLCDAPIYIAYDLGYFADEGLDVTLVAVDAETKKIDLNNGTLPIITGAFQMFPSIEQGINVQIVDGSHNGCIKMAVLPDSGIESQEDLAGKNIAVDEIGGSPYQVAQAWLADAGITDETFLPYGDNNLSLEALKSGEADAAVLWDPQASMAAKAGEVNIIFDNGATEGFSERYCCFVYASSKLVEENPEEIAAILRAFQKAQDYIANNTEDAVDIIIDGQYSAIEDRDLAIELLKSYNYPTYEDRENGYQDIEENITYYATLMNNIGSLTETPEEFLEKAYSPIDLTAGQ